MVKINAYIKLYKNGRKTPFYNGYRPLFRFVPETNTSGMIELVHERAFYPGQEGEVKISFVNDKYLGKDFVIGKRFLFGEGKDALGEGVVIDIL